MQNNPSSHPEKSEQTNSASSRNHAGTDPTTEDDVTRQETQSTTNAISRVFSIVVLMCIPGAAGHYLDQWLGTKFLTGIGFVTGMAVAIIGLLYVSNVADKSAKESKELRLRIRAKNEKGPQ